VRLGFQKTPWDLSVAVGYASLMSTILLALGVGNLLAIVLVLFAPGYVVVATLFPRAASIGWIERVALSFLVSVAVVPMLGLVLSLTPWGISFAPFVATISFFTIGLGLAAYRRRMLLPVEQRLALTLTPALYQWSEYAVVDKALTIAITAVILAATGTLGYLILASRHGERFTEFFILGSGRNATSYPTALKVGEPGMVYIGIINHEAAIIAYTIRVDLVGVAIVTNATVERNRTTQSWINVTQADGQDWTGPYTFLISYSGLWKVEFLLFKNGDVSNVYRELHLYVSVT